MVYLLHPYISVIANGVFDSIKLTFAGLPAVPTRMVKTETALRNQDPTSPSIIALALSTLQVRYMQSVWCVIIYI